MDRIGLRQTGWTGSTGPGKVPGRFWQTGWAGFTGLAAFRRRGLTDRINRSNVLPSGGAFYGQD